MFFICIKKQGCEIETRRTNSITLLKRMVERARENHHLVSYGSDTMGVNVDMLMAQAIRPTYNLLPEKVEA